MKKLLLLATLVAACGRASSETVTFGAAGPWSEDYGDANKKGIELAVEEINASPAWSNHRHLQIAFADDSASGVKASAIAQQFVDSAPIVAVVGHASSGAMVAAAHVYDKHLAAIATTATTPALTGISPWAFRVISSDSANAITIANFANKLGRKRAAVMYVNNSYGRGLADNFRHAFSGQIVSIDPIGEGTDQSPEPFVTWYKKVRPDIVLVASTGIPGLPFLVEAKRQQLQADIVGGDGLQTLANNPAAEGLYVGVPFTASDNRPEAQTFVSAYKRKFNARPDGNAALAYDATKILAAAVEAVGADRAKIRDYLASIDESHAYHGVTGAIRFRADGDPVGKGVVMTRVHGSALQLEANQ